MSALAIQSARSAAPATTARIAIIGNPNTGKTTLFNRLTGSRQRVGNYPGVTVEKKTGIIRLGDDEATLIDLPGTYSLAATSDDERIAVDVLSGRMLSEGAPDAVICVVDATNLMRNLFLVSQIADTGVPIVVALNMIDAAREQGIVIDVSVMEKRFGFRVVATVATRGEGIAELRKAIAETMRTRPRPLQTPWPEHVQQAREFIQGRYAAETARTLADADAIRLLFDFESSLPASLGWRADESASSIEEARDILRRAGLDPASAEAILRYGHISELLEDVITHPRERKVTTSETIDRILTHRVWGLIIFVGMMTVVFQSIYRFAVPFMDAIDAAFAWLGGIVGGWLASMPMLHSLIVDGAIAGVSSVLIFLPQILILFLFIALLEDTGYMARAAFLMDKLFSWCGLNGKSFVPLLSSYACAIPGVMATRSIEDRKARLVTILIAPLMSCSARLPVYVLLIGAFIEPAVGPGWAGFALVAMHFVGLAVAIPIAIVLNRWIVRGRRIPFVMEMPPYRPPMMRNVLWRMWGSASKFLKRAGTIIFAMTIIIWALAYFPRPDAVRDSFIAEVAAAHDVSVDRAHTLVEDEYAGELQSRYLEQSYLGRMGKTVQPVFAPAGFDWKITVGVIASFPAREVIVATLGVLYGLGEGGADDDVNSLADAMRAARWEAGAHAGSPVFTIPVALAIMIFFALCLQCGSTVAVIAREANWGWATFAFVYMTALAWLGAVAVYQIGSLVC